MATTRFAPSPTGYLHFGNVRTALFNWLLARQAGGAMQLRLEDTDRARSSEQYSAAVVEDLRWLGLDFSGDSSGQPWRQSQRTAEYEQQLQRLRGQTYPCFCTAEELAAERQAQRAAGRPPRYSGKCAQLAGREAQRRLDGGEAAAWRFRVPPGTALTVRDWVRGDSTFSTADLGDFVVRRASGDFSFLFANAVDDALLGVTDVLRGEDHAANTPRQILLLQALELPPPRYGHLALIVAAGGKPLSKRDGLTPVRDWRARGYLPAALVNYLARVGHHYAPPDGDALMTLDDLAARFSRAALGRAPAQLDESQLQQRQKESVLQLAAADYRQWLGEARLRGLRDADAFCALTRENITLPEDADAWRDIIAGDTLAHISPDAAALIEAAANAALFAAAAQAAEASSWQDFCQQIGSASGKKGKALFMPLRAALTGRTDGPAMPQLYALLTPAQRRARFGAAQL